MCVFLAFWCPCAACYPLRRLHEFGSMFGLSILLSPPIFLSVSFFVHGRQGSLDDQRESFARKLLLPLGCRIDLNFGGPKKLSRQLFRGSGVFHAAKNLVLGNGRRVPGDTVRNELPRRRIEVEERGHPHIDGTFLVRRRYPAPDFVHHEERGHGLRQLLRAVPFCVGGSTGHPVHLQLLPVQEAVEDIRDHGGPLPQADAPALRPVGAQIVGPRAPPSPFTSIAPRRRQGIERCTGARQCGDPGKEGGVPVDGLHAVEDVGEGEGVVDQKDHFVRLHVVRRNRGEARRLRIRTAVLFFARRDLGELEVVASEKRVLL
mmetsp:Transcript_5370/g.11304  ORF Transcript_5370/g.11304 Transcript_5370/m.11304 type:complete len:318 (-) Transcript_5370:154-1107(-)